VTQVELQIPAKLHNSLIGSQGRLIRSVMEDCGGVSIKFPAEGSKSDKVLIRGPKDDVEKAKKQLQELASEKVQSNTLCKTDDKDIQQVINLFCICLCVFCLILYIFVYLLFQVNKKNPSPQRHNANSVHSFQGQSKSLNLLNI